MLTIVFMYQYFYARRVQLKEIKMTTVLSSKSSTTQEVSGEQLKVRTGVSILAQNVSAAVFGLLIVYAVGFLPMEAAHNAAHDTRHSLAFPCH